MFIKKIVLFAIASILISSAYAEKLEFSKYGFSINSLDSSPTSGMVQPIQMFLPPLNGFAPNVNVQIQAYNGTIKQYRKLSEEQFKQYDFTILSIKETDNLLSLEYIGSMQGLSLHWYAKAFKKGSHVYLVTATGTQADWEVNKEELMSNVNSFQLK
ncbi:hypothetical protein [Colwellia sp. E2M01]|uniref:hypothetical protein n=1 Tax=Colwellia sp. E2M01 TaxID=2841561 RepID=UPI001C095F40|nr:hypothetical protein [Colwellia sp. E2M01]MBU2869861.1 hypothetical protein [Colwellia sp. E2M01]